jgi:hypothetical protein
MADKIYFAAASSLDIKNYIILSNDNYNSLCKINTAFSERCFDNLGEIIVFNMSKEKADNKVKVAAITSIERLNNTIKINFKDIIESDIKNEEA